MKEKLRALRIECGITQKELAEKIQSTSKSIWAYEKGIATPPIEVVKAYADFFGVSADYLLGRSDDLGYVTVQSSAPALSEKEETLLRYFRSLSDDLQGAALETVRVLAGVPAGNGLQKKA